jgi:preprotein translocase subunit SecA
MNKQRTVIYDERKKVLDGADLSDQIRPMIEDVVKGYIEGATSAGYAEEWDLEQLWTALKTLYPVSLTIDEAIEQAGGHKADLTREFLTEELVADAQAAYDAREEDLGPEVLRELERRVLLSVLDRRWREHLYEMDYLQEGIGLRAMAQRDPLVEYKREGFDMFAAMMDAIKEESVGFLFNLEVEVEDETSAPALEVGGNQPQLDLSLLAAAQEQHDANDRSARPHVSAKGLDHDGSQPKGLVYTSPELGSDTPSVQTSSEPKKAPATGNRRPARSNPNKGSRGNKRKR